LAQPTATQHPRALQTVRHCSHDAPLQHQSADLISSMSPPNLIHKALQRPSGSTIIPITSTDSILYFVGALCMAWSGTSPHCTRKGCPKCLQHTTTLYLRIIFPTWLLAKALIGSISYAQKQGLSFHNLRFPSVRPSSAEIFELVSLGDIAGMRRAFQNGSASVWDVDTDGNGLLWVSLRILIARALLELNQSNTVRPHSLQRAHDSLLPLPHLLRHRPPHRRL
jgi:hypothetical protein